jgi:hypothetical protein
LLVRLSLPYFIIPHAYVYIAALLHRSSINSVLHSSITTIREKMRSEGPTFLRRYDATLLEQVGSIFLRIGNHQPPQYIWNVAQMFLDRTYHMDYFWQGNRQFVTQLLKRRTENGMQREVHQPHKTLPQMEKNIPGFEYHFVVKRSEGREEAYEPLPTMAAGKYAYGRFRGSVQYQRY